MNHPINQVITNPALRVKVTGVCNRTCNFCNEEGDMRTIIPMEPNQDCFECVNTLADALEIKHAMITGGEPTIDVNLNKIVLGINTPEISITSNGIHPLSVNEWSLLHKAGLNKVIVSIHDATPQSLLRLETHQRKFGWAIRALESQKYNLMTAGEAGLLVRVNTVAYSSRDQVYQIFGMLESLQQKYRFDMRLLNDLANISKSQQIIRDVCQSLGAKTIGEERRAGSSNTTVLWETESGFKFSTKMAVPYFFNAVCNGCSIKNQCHEGFYGIRIERRTTGYWVRLCIYKHTPNVLMPWEFFLKSDLLQKLKEICQLEQS